MADGTSRCMMKQSVNPPIHHLHSNCIAVDAAPQRQCVDLWKKSTDAFGGDLGRLAIINKTSLVYYYSSVTEELSTQ